MSANESFPRPWRVERNPKNGLQNIVVAANGRLIAEPLPIDGATAEDCEAVAAEIAAVQRGGGNAAEPLSAILAEMCELAHGFANGEVCATARKVRQWVSRIEAAAEREHLRDATKMAGNAAAIREALEEFLDFSRRGLAFVTSYRYTEAENAEIEAAFDAAKSAIAAPARNCDRFATLDEARKAFQEARGHKVLADVELWDSMDEAGALVRWLFAPAEGGAEKGTDHA